MSRNTRIGIATCAIVAVAIFLYQVRHTLSPFIAALILVYILNPLVERLAHRPIAGRRLPRVAAVLIILGGLLASLAALLSYLIPALAQEVQPFRNSIASSYEQLVNKHFPNLVGWLQRSADQANIDVNVGISLEKALRDALEPSNLDGAVVMHEVQGLVGGLFSLIFSSVLVFILTLFLLLDWPKIRDGFWHLVPMRHAGPTRELLAELDRDLSGSIRGQLTICLINFVLTTVGLLILQVKYAVTLGLIAGAFSIVPVFGSIVSTVPIVLVTLTVSVTMAVKAILVIIFIHLLEANVLNPKVMGAHVELHPIVILFAIVSGEHFFGAVGLLVGVPVAASLRSIFRFSYRRFQDGSPEINTPSTPAPSSANLDAIHHETTSS